MVCKSWKCFQNLERINMCYACILLGHRWTRGLHGVYPPLQTSPPHPHLWVSLVTTLNPWIHEGLGHHEHLAHQLTVPTSFFHFRQEQMFNDTAVTTLLVELTLIARQWIVTLSGRIDLDHFEQLETICNVFHMMLSVCGPSTHLKPALWVWKAANTTVSTIETDGSKFLTSAGWNE